MARAAIFPKCPETAAVQLAAGDRGVRLKLSLWCGSGLYQGFLAGSGDAAGRPAACAMKPPRSSRRLPRRNPPCSFIAGRRLGRPGTAWDGLGNTRRGIALRRPGSIGRARFTVCASVGRLHCRCQVAVPVRFRGRAVISCGGRTGLVVDRSPGASWADCPGKRRGAGGGPWSLRRERRGNAEFAAVRRAARAQGATGVSQAVARSAGDPAAAPVGGNPVGLGSAAQRAGTGIRSPRRRRGSRPIRHAQEVHRKPSVTIAEVATTLAMSIVEWGGGLRPKGGSVSPLVRSACDRGSNDIGRPATACRLPRYARMCVLEGPLTGDCARFPDCRATGARQGHDGRTEYAILGFRDSRGRLDCDGRLA